MPVYSSGSLDVKRKRAEPEKGGLGDASLTDRVVEMPSSGQDEVKDCGYVGKPAAEREVPYSIGSTE